MARGYPDFFGTSVFPMYGANSMSGNLVWTIASGALSTVLGADGKFVIQGGYLWIENDDSFGATVLTLYIDGVVLFSDSLANLFDYQAAGKWNFPLNISRYSPADYIYVLGFPGIYTVGTGWRLDVQNMGTLLDAVVGTLWLSTVV